MSLEIGAFKDSNEFLNLLLDSIDTAVLIADENLEIHQFNSSFISLFDRAYDQLVDITFGPASGCAHSVREGKACGETSACGHCVLRRSLLETFLKKVPIDKKRLERVFYIDGVPTQKYLEFTARQIYFQGYKMILVFIYDITEIVQSKMELQHKQTQIDLDLAAAGDIQKSLLPQKLPAMPSIRADWRFEPCQEIGGDIFHLYQEDQNHISAYMLDVCGHGVSAALIAVTAKQFLDNLHRQALANGYPTQPKDVLKALEKEFPFEKFDSYFTIVYTLLNTANGDLTYGCAGHVPPLVLGGNPGLTPLNDHGPVIGIGDVSALSHSRSRLMPGQKIILYTDGLLENFTPEDDGRGKEYFHSTLLQLSDRSVEQIADGVMAGSYMLRKGAEPSDDMSILIIEFVG